MHLVVGLGNPGSRYARTRHNVGFVVVEELARRWDVPLGDKRFRAVLGDGRVAGEKVVMAMPQTYMNRSGDSIGPMAGWFKLPPEQVVVIHDDLDLPFGAVKVKAGGGHGGHNGLRDLVKKLPSADFLRVRFGIGRPDGPMDSADYVLARWSEDENRALPERVGKAADAVEDILRHGVREAMNRINGEGKKVRNEREPSPSQNEQTGSPERAPAMES